MTKQPTRDRGNHLCRNSCQKAIEGDKKFQSEESVGFLKPQVHLAPTTLSQLKADAGGLNDFLLNFEGGSNKMQGDYFKMDDMRQLLRMDLLANLPCCIACTLFPWAS